MRLEEIQREIREQTFGLLNPDEIENVCFMALYAHWGIDPEDVTEVLVTFENLNVDVKFIVREHPKLF
jgi:hypothetical protein